MRNRCVLVGVCLATLVATGCGHGTSAEAEQQPPSPDVATTAPSDTERTQFGDTHRFADGLTVSVSRARPFTPSDTAYPSVDHAIRVDVVLRNDGDRAYRRTGLAITASIDGASCREIIDSTQGIYGHSSETDRDLAVGRKTRLIVAFEAAEDGRQARVDVQPRPDDPAVATFTGPVP